MIHKLPMKVVEKMEPRVGPEVAEDLGYITIYLILGGLIFLASLLFK